MYCVLPNLQKYMSPEIVLVTLYHKWDLVRFIDVSEFVNKIYVGREGLSLVWSTITLRG